MTENKTIIYTFLMSKLKHSLLKGRQIFPLTLKNRGKRGGQNVLLEQGVMDILYYEYTNEKVFVFHSLDYLKWLMLSIFSMWKTEDHSFGNDTNLPIVKLILTRLPITYVQRCHRHEHNNSSDNMCTHRVDVV